uniref:Uncharacterized protein n=1 Tax=Oryza brachyantha TaxID=4533 RepID=J3KUI0_ORYBR
MEAGGWSAGGGNRRGRGRLGRGTARSLGLDPVTIASVFSAAVHVGEKQVEGEDCFALQLDVGPSILSTWSDDAVEVIRHGMTGYFSQRSDLLARLEDSQLTHSQALEAPAIYWKTTIASSVANYRTVDGDAVRTEIHRMH